MSSDSERPLKERLLRSDSRTNTPKRLHPGQIAVLIVSTILCLVMSAIVLTRPDTLAAMTVFPVWVWMFPGIGIAALAIRRNNLRPFLVVAGLWLLQAAILSEEPRSLLRFTHWPSSEWSAAHRAGLAIRVISINCAGGNAKALAEVAPYNPDIVLVQETPGRPAVEKIAHSLYGNEAGSWVNFDASILARGRVIPIQLTPKRGFFAQARVELRSGITIEVFSVHTLTPPFRMDLWNPENWRAYSANRATQRGQLGIITNQMRQISSGVPVICGGDFNAPQGDPVAVRMAPRLRDSFAEAGKGWRNTFTNDMPALRIDQIWISRQLKPSVVFAHKTVESDHRMVVCDLIVR